MIDADSLPLALVFDDDRAVAEALRARLAALGYEVQIADDIVDARRALTQMTVAVVVVELGRATERGRHLIEDLASHPDVPPMLVVADDEPARLMAQDFSVACVDQSCDLEALGAALTLARSFRLRPIRRPRGISVRRQAVLEALLDAANLAGRSRR